MLEAGFMSQDPRTFEVQYTVNKNLMILLRHEGNLDGTVL